MAGHFHQLYRWNRRINLTAIRQWKTALDRHVAESWAGADILARTGLSDGLLVDLGSGNGYPEIPLLAGLPGMPGLLVEARALQVDLPRSFRRTVALQ